MINRKGLIAAAIVAILAAACSSASTSPAASSAPATQPPGSQAAASEAAVSPPASETPVASIGPGEGELDLVAWVGYAEDGSNVKEYDWVHPFVAANPDCAKVVVKTANTSDEMYTLMTNGHGLYDGVSASGDASNRLIDRAEVAPVDPALIPDFKDLTPFLQDPPNNTVNGFHYGVSHGWGGNTLMYRTDKIAEPPTSWDSVFDPAKAAANKGKITDYGGAIYIADAALYLKTHKPELRDHRSVRADPGAVRCGGRPSQGPASVRREVLDGRRGRGRQLQHRDLDDRHDLAVPDEHAQGLQRPGRGRRADGGDDRLVRHLDAVAIREAPELHAQVDGLDGHARDPGAGRGILR